MNSQNQTSNIVIITETKWVSGRCIKASQKFNQQTGQSETKFTKWVNGRWLPTQKKLMPGYWAEVKFYELDLMDKIRQSFARLLNAGQGRQ